MNFDSVPNLFMGTSSWSAESWVGPFYPPGTPPADFLPIYATHYNTVEIDSTYYRIPSRKMVQGWRDRTPPGFTFAAKFPGEVTHKKLLADCERETDEFLGVMELLGEKLGPLLLQFPYLNQEVMPSCDEFLSRLARYLERLPRTHRYAVEVRYKNWLAQPLLDLLRAHGVALALVDQVWMPTITQLTEKLDVLTADFTYIRWIGDRKGIEKQTKTWDKIIVNRERETQTWVRYVRQFLHRGEIVYAYYNNHYGGYGPGSIALFRGFYVTHSDMPWSNIRSR
ncbi:MAG: DUF72 domain-containing protein [Terriglobia bacterium]